MKKNADICTREEEIAQVEVGAPHVVILGSGASLASCPNGDKNGRQLPVMKNFVKTLNLAGILKRAGVDLRKRNFEEIYDQLYRDKKYSGIRQELEDAIYDYFVSMRLPDHPTIYDHLVLSLRDKDAIATFNWDPLLTQAYRRNSTKFRLPRLIFLHGNVTIGYCRKDEVVGVNGGICSHCGKKFIPSKLLYPIKKKNYHTRFNFGEWKDLTFLMNRAFMITIFGYGAPKSDVNAVDLLKKGWGVRTKRSMEQVEIIDKKPEKILRATWDDFILTHHYDVCSDFYNSWIANHPRRTGEAYLNQYYWGKVIENNPIPRNAKFPELWEWYNKLSQVETGMKNMGTN